MSEIQDRSWSWTALAAAWPNDVTFDVWQDFRGAVKGIGFNVNGVRVEVRPVDGASAETDRAVLDLATHLAHAAAEFKRRG